MSFDKLMEEAWDIEETAVRKAVERHEADPDYAAHGVENYYTFVPDLFKPFSQMPDPKAYQPYIEDLRKVLQDLSSGDHNQDPINTKENYFANPTFGKVTTASDYLTGWTGSAAMQFKQRFLDQMPPLTRNQFILTSILKSALEAHQAMWDKARNDIDTIVHKTLDALENQPCCDSNTWTITFTVVAAVAFVAAVPLAPIEGAGIALATSVTAVGSAASVAAVAPPEASKSAYAGESVKAIIEQMRQAVVRLGQEIHNVETTIFKALDATHTTVAGSQALFVAPRPNLADATAGNITDPQHMGYK